MLAGVYQRTAGSTIESAANTQAPDAARPTNQGALTMEKLERGPPHRTTLPKGSGAGCRRGAVAGRVARLTTSIASAFDAGWRSGVVSCEARI
ncbi:unnamed protein product [Gadus morhua 'NCC']